MALITPPDHLEFPTLAGRAYAWLRLFEDAGPSHDHEDLAASHAAVVAALGDPAECVALLHLIVLDTADKLRALPLHCDCGDPSCGVAMTWVDPATGRTVPIEQAIPHRGERLVIQAVFAARNGDDPGPFLEQLDLGAPADKAITFSALTQMRTQFHLASHLNPPTPGDPT